MKFFGILFLILFFTASVANAGAVNNIFGKSVFGVDWADGLDQVKEMYPNGRTESSSGNQKYIVEDIRDIMGFSFDEANEITYVFNHDILTHIDVSFSDKKMETASALGQSLVAAFGNGQVSKPISGVVMTKWPQDNGMVLSFIQSFSTFGNGIHLNIQNTKTSPDVFSKKSLGFD